MADPTEAVSGLIERIEAAGEGSRELDALIHEAVTTFPARRAGPGWLDENGLVVPDFPGWKLLPPYSASIDAAVTLVPEGWYWRAGHGVLWPGWAHLNVKHPDHCDYGDEHTAHAETPSLALCAAALKARAHPTGSIKGGDRG